MLAHSWLHALVSHSFTSEQKAQGVTRTMLIQLDKNLHSEKGAHSSHVMTVMANS